MWGTGLHRLEEEERETDKYQGFWSTIRQTLEIRGMQPNQRLKNGQNSKYYVMYILLQNQ